MANDPLGDRIDHLYQLPLDQFTPARNALAKEAGPDIKKLEKPNASAWAINQVYWHDRKIYDALIEAATRRQKAYRDVLAGKTTDVSAVDEDHRTAIRNATRAARAILERDGGKPTDAVMTAVAETLDALPSAEPPGRLTKSLRRIGFGGLEGVPIVAFPKKASAAPKPARAAPAKPPAAKARHADEARAREIEMSRERLRFAEAAEREAEARLERAHNAVERANRIRDRVEQELAEAKKAADVARREEVAAESALEKASAERERLARKT